MWKPSSIFISVLLVVDVFFVSYAVGLNSRYVDAPAPQAAAAATSTTTTTTTTTRSPVETPTSKGFTDIKSTDARLVPSVTQAADAGILDPTEDKRFRPNEPVTRADFTRWMVRVRQVQPIVAAKPTYNDVNATNKYFPDIEGATRAMMVQGYNVKGSSGKEFKPDNFITRQEFAVMYGTFSGKRGRAEKLSKDEVEKYLRYDPSATTYGTTSFKDVGDVDDWARKWVAVAQQAGVLEQAFAVSPYDKNDDEKYLRPQQKMTRAEAVNILVKLYGLQSKSAVQEPAG